MIKRLAETIKARYGSDPKEALQHCNVEVIEHHLEGRLKEIYFGDVVVVKKNIHPIERDHYLAHALGHHLIHKTGNYLYLDSQSYLTKIKREGEAEEFAAYFLLSDKDIETIKQQHQGVTVNQIAFERGVTVQPLVRRIELFARDYGVSCTTET